MNEKNFIRLDFSNQNIYRNYGGIPELNSVEEIREQEAESANLKEYTTPAKVFDEFLYERFGYNIEGFRKLYLSKHIANFSEETSVVIQNIHPIPEKMRIYFGEVKYSRFELLYKYTQWKETIETHSSCSGPFPLIHSEKISNFTIIRSPFSKLLGKTESSGKLENNYFLGYYFSNEKFRFLISSSMQLDLTVIYEEI